ncbi:MAG TPA: pentapeptide repeat-containing protein, partial [Tepidisphaeraceae bacterium]
MANASELAVVKRLKPVGFATGFGCLLIASSAMADIFQWQWVDPNDQSLGKSQSTALCPGGAGIVAGPGSAISNRDLTNAYLYSLDLSSSGWASDTLTEAYAAKANLAQSLLLQCSAASADFSQTDAHAANFRFTDVSHANFTDANLQQAHLDFSTLDGANFTRANLTGGSMEFSSFSGANFTDAVVAGVSFVAAVQGGFTQQQLRQTASYKNHDLHGIHFW